MKKDLLAVCGIALVVVASFSFWYVVFGTRDQPEVDYAPWRGALLGKPTITWEHERTFQTGIMYDGPGRFVIVKQGNAIWRGTHDEFIALVETGLACAPSKVEN